MDRRQRQDIERQIGKRLASTHPLHLFAGIGTARLTDYLIRHEKLSMCLSGEAIRHNAGLVTGASYLVGLFSDYDQRGYCESADFHEALVIAAAQALGILPQVGPKRTVFARGAQHVQRQTDDTDKV